MNTDVSASRGSVLASPRERPACDGTHAGLHVRDRTTNVDHVVGERRADARAGVSATSVRATLRPGNSVEIVDLSRRGALVQCARPMRPGGRVHLQVVTPDRTVTVAARVLRCSVWALHPTEGARYRGALHFDDPCELFGEHDSRHEAVLPGPTTARPGRQGHALPAAGGPAQASLRGSGR
jgi:hypothetical protein